MLPVLGALAGSALAPSLGVSALTAGAIGSGLGGFIQSGDLGQGIMTGLGSYATGGMYGKVAGMGNLADKQIMGMSAPKLAQIAGAALGGGASMPMKSNQVKSRGPANPYGFRSVKGMQAGGITDIVAPQELNDKEIILAVSSALRGAMPKEQAVRLISEFVARFGKEALLDVADKVQKGAIAQTERPSEGMVRGAGDGMDDLVPASLEGTEDILLSQDEYILPADFLSHLGNGSSEAGGRIVDNAVDKVRMQRTGTTQQAPQIDGEAIIDQMIS